jgi:hypothetical protein
MRQVSLIVHMLCARLRAARDLLAHGGSMLRLRATMATLHSVERQLRHRTLTLVRPTSPATLQPLNSSCNVAYNEGSRITKCEEMLSARTKYSSDKKLLAMFPGQ